MGHAFSVSVISNQGSTLSCPVSNGRGGGDGRCFQTLYGQKRPPLSSRSPRASHSSKAHFVCWARAVPCHRKPLFQIAGKRLN